MSSFLNGQPTSTTLTEEEKERYDRQIRVWGAEAQSRIQSSSVLICGLRCLSVEVVKNIVLAGVSVVILDDGVVSMDDVSYNFFVTPADIGKQMVEAAFPRIHDLNNFASIKVETKSIDSLGDEYFQQFNVILCSDSCSEAQALRLDNLCRNRTSSTAVFFWCGMFGEEAWFFSDFGPKFEYKDDAPRNKDIKVTSFPSLDNVLAKKWNTFPSRHFPLSLTFVKSRILATFRNANNQRNPTVTDIPDLVTLSKKLLVDNSIDETFVSDDQIHSLCSQSMVAPVMICSVLGSFLAQEVIKAVSLSGEPGRNFFVFSAQNLVVRALPLEG